MMCLLFTTREHESQAGCIHSLTAKSDSLLHETPVSQGVVHGFGQWLKDHEHIVLVGEDLLQQHVLVLLTVYPLMSQET